MVSEPRAVLEAASPEAPLSLRNDAEISDLFNDLFPC